MAQLNLKITLDNVSDDFDANSIATTIENIVSSFAGIPAHTTVYDNDAPGTSNPIMTHNTLRKIKRG